MHSHDRRSRDAASANEWISSNNCRSSQLQKNADFGKWLFASSQPPKFVSNFSAALDSNRAKSGLLALSQSAGRNVDKPQLHALFALPAINGDVTCRMQDAATVVEQSSSKRLAYGPKCDGIDEFSIAGPESCPHMAFADRIRINERVGWKRKQWFRITGAVGTGSRQHIGK
jgi:hypothetical protein